MSPHLCNETKTRLVPKRWNHMRGKRVSSRFFDIDSWMEKQREVLTCASQVCMQNICKTVTDKLKVLELSLTGPLLPLGKLLNYLLNAFPTRED